MTTTTSKTTLTGREAIAYAREHGLDVQKYADPTEGARSLTPDEADQVAREDPSLLWVEVQQYATVGSNGVELVVWGLGETREAAEADADEHLAETTGERPELVTVPCSPATAELIRDGAVTLRDDSPARIDSPLVPVWRGATAFGPPHGEFSLDRLERLEAASEHEPKITIDPEEPFAGLVAPEDIGDLPTEVRAKGARVVAVDILTAASAAGCGTWDDEALRTLTKALEKMGEDEVAKGDRVEAGEGDDHDTGRVLAVDGDRAEVGWDSGVRTWTPVSDLRRL
jgi:hypothetical protein